MAGKINITRLIRGSTAKAAAMLDKNIGVLPEDTNADGRFTTAGLSLPLEGVWWPTKWDATGVNALESAASVGVVVGPDFAQGLTADTLNLLADPQAVMPSTEVPPLESSVWAQTPYPGKPRIAGGQPALLVPGARFGTNRNAIAINVGEPMVADVNNANGGEYSRSVYQINPPGSPVAGLLDTERFGTLPSMMYPCKIVDSRWPNQSPRFGHPPAAVAWNFGGGDLFTVWPGHGFGYIAGAGRAATRRIIGASPTNQRPAFNVTVSGAAPSAILARPSTPTVQALPAVLPGRNDLVALTGSGERIIPLRAYMSATHGGPIFPGFAQDIHRLGATPDNEAVNPASLNCAALWGLSGSDGWGEFFHGPLRFELIQEPRVIGGSGVPTRVHLQWSKERKHRYSTGFVDNPQGAGFDERDGDWAWWVPMPARKAVPTTGDDQEWVDPSIPPAVPPVDNPPPRGPAITGGGKPVNPMVAWDGGHFGGTGFVFYGAYDNDAPLASRAGMAQVGVFTAHHKARATTPIGSVDYTQEAVIDWQAFDAAEGDLSGSLAAQRTAGTASGVVSFHPPELSSEEIVYGAAIPATRDLSEVSFAIHRATFGFGATAEDGSGIVDGWRVSLDGETLRFQAVDENGAATAIPRITDHGKVIPRVHEVAGDPTVGDDGTLGYQAGDAWRNTADNGLFLCKSNATGAAVWQEVTAGGGGGVASVQAGDNISVDNTDPANPVVALADVVAVGTSLTLPNGGFFITDTGGDHTFNIKPGENLTANRSLTVSLSDGDRTLAIPGNATVSGTNTGDQFVRTTSTTSLAIGTGSKAFTTANALEVGVGTWLRAYSAAGAGNFMVGQVTAISGTSLTISVVAVGGSGTLSDWVIVLSGAVSPGDVVGPASSTDEGIASYDNTTGKLIKSVAGNQINPSTGAIERTNGNESGFVFGGFGTTNGEPIFSTVITGEGSVASSNSVDITIATFPGTGGIEIATLNFMVQGVLVSEGSPAGMRSSKIHYVGLANGGGMVDESTNAYSDYDSTSGGVTFSVSSNADTITLTIANGADGDFYYTFGGHQVKNAP